MPLPEEIKNTLNNIVISSYETRIQSFESLLDTIHQILEGFQNSFLDTKQEQEKINAQLRENLAQNNSLRKKDFDQMMQGILLTQDERERAVRNLLDIYLNEQKQMVHTLRDNLTKVKNALANGEIEKIEEFQAGIKEMLTRQEKGREEVTSNLKEFQKEQHQMLTRVKTLLKKGRELRINDLKEILEEFEIQHKERMSRQQERKEEVRSMLENFKQQRMKWRDAQNKMAQ